MSDDYIYYGPETAALEISSDGKVQRVIPRVITVEKGSATPVGDGFDKYRQYDQDLRDAYAKGFAAALDAAWIAVGNVPCATTTHGDDFRDIPGPIVKRNALAAIDALKEKK